MCIYIYIYIYHDATTNNYIQLTFIRAYTSYNNNGTTNQLARYIVLVADARAGREGLVDVEHHLGPAPGAADGRGGPDAAVRPLPLDTVAVHPHVDHVLGRHDHVRARHRDVQRLDADVLAFLKWRFDYNFTNYSFRKQTFNFKKQTTRRSTLWQHIV